MSLVSHPLGYQGWPVGWPYADRHCDLARQSESFSRRSTHGLIAVVEYLPVIGAVASITEYVVYAIFGRDTPPWWQDGRPASAEEAMRRMVRNQEKAIEEHYKEGPWFGNPYPRHLTPDPEQLVREKPQMLHLSHHVADAQGPRDAMEDAHFYLEMGRGVLAGVFDGHGGDKVSAYASRRFQEKFPRALKQASGNVHEAFERVIHEIHREVTDHAAWNGMGSTAVVCYVDRTTHQVFTATLGDSEANIYRKAGWGWHSIPLSCVRDFLSEKDLSRLRAIYGPFAISDWIKQVGGNAKGVRSRLEYGVNVARAIGDVDNVGEVGEDRVIHKPKITVDLLKPGDRLVLACDGLKDFVPEKDIVRIVRSYVPSLFRKIINAIFERFFGKEEPRPLANKLVDAALERMDDRHNDNVTVLAIEAS